MPRKKFSFQSVGRHVIEPYAPSDNFDSVVWERVCAGFRETVPASLVSILQTYSGSAFAAPISFGNDVFDEETDILLGEVKGLRSIQDTISYLHHEFGTRGVLPIFGGLWNLVYVVDGKESGRVVEMDYFEDPSRFRNNKHFSVELGQFLDSLWFCPEMYYPDEPTPIGRQLVPEALSGNWAAIASAIGTIASVDSAMDSNGWTLLWYAAWANEVDIMRNLIGCGADIDAPLKVSSPGGDRAYSALAIIARRGVNLSAAEVLLEAGADVTTDVSSGHEWFESRAPAPLMHKLLKRYGFNQPTIPGRKKVPE